MIKRLILVLAIVLTPFLIGLLFTYDIIKLEWISTMKIQPVAQPQRDPLPLPARSVPIQGAAYIAGLGAPVNPVPARRSLAVAWKAVVSRSTARCATAKMAKGSVRLRPS